MEEQKMKHVCKFCKKRFVCGRSLGGHIRCHLPKPGYELRENPKKTWRVVPGHGDLMIKSSATSSSSSFETEAERLRMRKLNQGQGHAKGKRSSLVGNNSHSSVSEVVEEEQQEEDDVAMCLIMLSRDVGPWGSGKNPKGGSRKNKRKRRENGEKMVLVTSEHLQKGLKMKGIEVSENGLLSNDQSFNISVKIGEFTASENVTKGVKIEEFQESENEVTLSTDKMIKDHDFGKFGNEAMSNTPEKSYSKRSKFECTTCNKVFHSYQALGGHKASHKKLLGAKDCPSPNYKEEQPQKDEQIITDISLGSSSTISKKVVQKHECPICFRVFPSGQALGGHKRSHLVGSNNTEAKISQSIKTEDFIERSLSSSETRDMLDLNLPPVHVQEDGNPTIATASSSNSLVGLIKPYWWVENPHKHEAFLSLISN